MIYVMSGGDDLNLKLVNGASVPSTSKENTIWVKTSTAIHAWDLSPTQPHRRSKTKNLLTRPFYNSDSSVTKNGITWTVNSDGSITASGTATADSTFQCVYSSAANGEILLEPGTYTLSGCPSGGGSTKYNTQIGYSYDDWASTSWNNMYGTTPVTITITKTAKARINCVVKSGQTVSMTFKPQLEKGSEATSFVKGDATGQVWIQTSDSDGISLNALKKDGIWLNIKGCKQHNGSSWVIREASIYQSGVWIDLPTELVLFDSSVTSGFTLINQLSDYGSASISGGKMTLTGTYVPSGADLASALYYKSAKVSTSGYTKARVTVDSAFDSLNDNAFDTSKSKAKLVLQSTPTADITAANAAEVSITGPGTYTVALPSGSYYVGLMVNARAKLIVSKIWLE